MNSLVSPPARISPKAAVLAMVVALGIILVPAGSAHADDDDATWTVRTASNSLGSERTSYSYTLSPGGTVTDAVVIANNGTTALDLGVYAADGYTTKSGQFDLLVGGAKSANIGAWTSSDSDGAMIAPGESKEIPFTLTVPKTATPGDYAGGIVTSLVNAEQQDGINVDRRLGIRIALRVSGDLKPSLVVEDSHLSWGGGLNPFDGSLFSGDASLSYTIHNTGNTLLSARQAATVAGPFGWFGTDAATVKATPRLLPGERWNVTVPISDVPAAVWLAASASITPIAVDASGSTSALTPVAATANSWAIPWILLVMIVVLAALIVAGVLLAKRLRVRRQSREDERVRDAVERALGEKDTATA
jgi:hypothetical protein